MRLPGPTGRFLLGALLLLFAFAVHAQSNVAVTVSEVIDDRMQSEMLTGSLQLQLKLSGTGLDKVSAARVIVKEARDDRGTDLAKEWKAPDFRGRDVNGGVLEVSLASPPRNASTVRVKGNVELFVPGKDPGAVVTVPKALSKLDAPLSSAGLKAAGISITPLSAARYTEEKKKQKITEKDIEEIRAQGKAHGASEKEIEMAIEFAKAMEQMGGDAAPEGSVILSGSRKAFDQIHSVEIIGPDKQKVHVSSTTTSSRGDSSVMVMQPDSIPDGAALRFTLLTSKARVSVPFELKKVDLP